jgi:hypothetical protein
MKQPPKMSITSQLRIAKVMYPKYYKHNAYALGHEMSFVCIAYFYPKKYTLTPKLIFLLFLYKPTC